MVCGHAIRDGGGADAAIGEAVGALLIECCRDAEVAVAQGGRRRMLLCTLQSPSLALALVDHNEKYFCEAHCCAAHPQRASPRDGGRTWAAGGAGAALHSPAALRPPACWNAYETDAGEHSSCFNCFKGYEVQMTLTWDLLPPPSFLRDGAGLCTPLALTPPTGLPPVATRRCKLLLPMAALRCHCSCPWQHCAVTAPDALTVLIWHCGVCAVRLALFASLHNLLASLGACIMPSFLACSLPLSLHCWPAQTVASCPRLSSCNACEDMHR